MKDRKLFLLLIFLPILLSLFFLDLETNLSAFPEKTGPSENSQQLPSSIMENAKLAQFDESGIKTQQLDSPKLTYQNSLKLVEMNTPAIQLEAKDGAWLVESDRGEFDQNSNRISLIGGVVLIQNNQTAQTPIKMSMEQLDYYSESQIAETNTAVVIEAEGHYIESLGMRMDIANSVFVLTERVRSTHEPM